MIICHQLNTKNNIISGSEVSRLSVAIQASPTLLSVDVINDPLPAAENDTLCTFSSAHASATSCHVEFRHGKMTLENPSSELLTVLIRELTGRTQ